MKYLSSHTQREKNKLIYYLNSHTKISSNCGTALNVTAETVKVPKVSVEEYLNDLKFDKDFLIRTIRQKL